ncbi:uncharacterized protein BJ171DRAFT_606653 [Polychytrium aggregatum]|uniref:uncharacterized protein n=1 Tax=Polychytrium aggregatum TaxID=110093 RepID=UPI0022FDBFD4|nr:uncharacterized protein BJ171DRAFT_606653 [Polychytrium aggregatum]KAI9190701.1 hypothetical protein BJ171DRAFT_606653 [Polychytrium aggregatum]
MSDIYIKNVGFVGSVGLLASSIMGPGIVTIPLLYQQCGWFAPTIAFLVFALLSGLGSLYLTEALTAFPGNERFQRNVEYVTLVHQFYGRKAYYAMHVILYLSMQSVNIATIVLACQQLDAVIGVVFGQTCGFAIYPWSQSGFICQPGNIDANSPFQNTIMLFTLGYLVFIFVCAPLSALNLNDNIIVQFFSFLLTVSVIVIWCIMFISQGLNWSLIHPETKDVSQVVGTVMFNYAFITQIPSWLNTKHKDVSIFKSIFWSLWLPTIQFIFVGIIGAVTVPIPENSNIISSFLTNTAANSPVLVLMIVILNLIFSITVLLPTIPVYIIIMRLNLVTSGFCSHEWATFFAAVLPFILVIPFQTGDWLTQIVNWSSLFFASLSNFIIPYMVYIFLSRRNKELNQSVLDELEFLYMDTNYKKKASDDDEDDFDFVYHLPHTNFERLGIDRGKTFEYGKLHQRLNSEASISSVQETNPQLSLAEHTNTSIAPGISRGSLYSSAPRERSVIRPAHADSVQSISASARVPSKERVIDLDAMEKEAAAGQATSTAVHATSQLSPNAPIRANLKNISVNLVAASPPSSISRNSLSRIQMLSPLMTIDSEEAISVAQVIQRNLERQQSVGSEYQTSVEEKARDSSGYCSRLSESLKSPTFANLSDSHVGYPVGSPMGSPMGSQAAATTSKSNTSLSHGTPRYSSVDEGIKFSEPSAEEHETPPPGQLVLAVAQASPPLSSLIRATPSQPSMRTSRDELTVEQPIVSRMTSSHSATGLSPAPMGRLAPRMMGMAKSNNDVRSEADGSRPDRLSNVSSGKDLELPLASKSDSKLPEVVPFESGSIEAQVKDRKHMEIPVIDIVKSSNDDMMNMPRPMSRMNSTSISRTQMRPRTWCINEVSAVSVGTSISSGGVSGQSSVGAALTGKRPRNRALLETPDPRRQMAAAQMSRRIMASSNERLAAGGLSKSSMVSMTTGAGREDTSRTGTSGALNEKRMSIASHRTEIISIKLHDPEMGTQSIHQSVVIDQRPFEALPYFITRYIPSVYVAIFCLLFMTACVIVVIFMNVQVALNPSGN